MTKELLQKCLDALDKSIIFANSQGIGGWQPTAMACHEAKAAIKQALAQQDQPSKTERQIRRMFCATYASNSSPYMDDGEAQDNSMHPCIDFLRDSPEQIQSKMVERAIAKHKEQHEQPVLSDDEIFDLAGNYDCGTREENERWIFTSPNQMLTFARAIEAHCRGGVK